MRGNCVGCHRCTDVIVAQTLNQLTTSHFSLRYKIILKDHHLESLHPRSPLLCSPLTTLLFDNYSLFLKSSLRKPKSRNDVSILRIFSKVQGMQEKSEAYNQEGERHTLQKGHGRRTADVQASRKNSMGVWFHKYARTMRKVR